MKCKRCGKEPFDVRNITLLGNYIANLCTDCRNQWNQFIIASEEYHQRNMLEIHLRVAIIEKDLMEALAIESKILKNGRKLLELGQQWCEGKEYNEKS